VRLNEKSVRDNRAESAQRRDKTELTDLFTEVEIQLDAAQAFLSMLHLDCVLGRQFHQAEGKEHYNSDKDARHNSLP
jgi:hypothetical protein